MLMYIKKEKEDSGILKRGDFFPINRKKLYDLFKTLKGKEVIYMWW
jgi:hypothetical protein